MTLDEITEIVRKTAGAYSYDGKLWTIRDYDKLSLLFSDILELPEGSIRSSLEIFWFQFHGEKELFEKVKYKWRGDVPKDIQVERIK